MYYRKKPVVIEAIQWNGNNLAEVKEFVGDDLECEFCLSLLRDEIKKILEPVKIKTLEGDMNASIGDYIIKGVDGEFYPCKPDIFEKTYEEVQPEEVE